MLFFAELVLKGLPEQPNGARIGLGIDPVPGIRICFLHCPDPGVFQRSVYILFSGMKTGIMTRINKYRPARVTKSAMGFLMRRRPQKKLCKREKLCKRDFPDHSALFS